MRWLPTVGGPTRLRGIPRWVTLAFATVALLPVIVWLAHPPPTPHLSTLAGIISMMLGTLLATIVFMLWAAQNSRQSALSQILEEFSERDRRLCKAARSDDIEPWLPLMHRELRHLETIAAIAVLRPAERRHCQWNKREREKAMRKARALEREADAQARNGLSPKESRDYCRLQERIDVLTLEHEEIIRSAGSRIGKEPTASTPDRPLSELALQFEDVLSADLRPLETAYVLTASVLSLTAIGAAYSRQAILWPVPPGLLAATIIATIAVLYIVVVRRAMTQSSLAFARRLRRLTAPMLQDAGVLLGDSLVVRATTPGDPAATRLQEALGTLPPVELPLRHRLLGQYHLAVAWQSLPERSDGLPRMSDFGCVARSASVAAEKAVQELELARDHLEQAARARHDDPLSVLALDAVYDAMAAVRGKDALAPERRAIADAALSRPGSDGLGWADQLRQHRWLWPRDSDRLTRLLAGLDADQASPIGQGHSLGFARQPP